MRGPDVDKGRTPDGFQARAVDAETGTVVWPRGAELAPDTLCEHARYRSVADEDVAA
jgi:hypothetical protein